MGTAERKLLDFSGTSIAREHGAPRPVTAAAAPRKAPPRLRAEQAVAQALGAVQRLSSRSPQDDRSVVHQGLNNARKAARRVFANSSVRDGLPVFEW